MRLFGLALLLVDTGTPLLACLLLGLLLGLTRSLGLGSKLVADKTEAGLKTLCGIEVVVDETETDAAASTEGGLEAKGEDGLGVSDLEHLGKGLLDLSAGDGGTALVGDLDDKLLALEETVHNELADTEGAAGKSLVRHVC